jgi:hypothetical protein
MLILARKVLWLSLLVFSAHSAIAAADGPNPYLKGIKIINYRLFVEKVLGGNDCKIDQGNLDNSIQFVANQSTNLKIESNSQHVRHLSELLGKPFSELYKSNVLKEPERDYVLMPTFSIGITPLQTTQFTCAGTIKGELSAYIEEKPHIIPTQVVIALATVEIWSKESTMWVPNKLSLVR